MHHYRHMRTEIDREKAPRVVPFKVSYEFVYHTHADDFLFVFLSIVTIDLCRTVSKINCNFGRKSLIFITPCI